MWQTLISLGIIVADYAYHRWIAPPPIPPPPNLTINVPTTADGSPIPLVYGRVRVDRPILVWTSPAVALTDDSSGTPKSLFPSETSALYVYAVDMAFVVGIGFGFDNHNTQGTWGDEVGDPPGWDYCQINRMWVGQAEAIVVKPDDPDTHEPPGIHNGYLIPSFKIDAVADDSLLLGQGQKIELLSGNPATQNLFNAGGFPLTHLADRLYLFPTTPTPTWYRNVITVCLFANEDSGPTTQAALMPEGAFTNAWYVGTSGQIPSYAFEVSAYPGNSLTAPSLYLFQNANALIGVDANPIDVLYDLFTGTFSKGRVPVAAIDMASWQAAALQLATEGNGFSRVWDSATTASDMVSEILRQIDGTLYEDPSTGLIGIKLIRPDYDLTTLQNINPSNCIRIEGFTLGGQTDVPNVVQVNFKNRQTDYQQDFRVAASQANSVNQGTYIVSNVDMPGVCDPTNAQQIANRELTAQSRPLAKCTASVSRDFYRVKIGDPLTLTWPEAGISGMVMRVASIDRGTLADGTIKLDLIQDYFYQWKRNPPVQLGGFGYRSGPALVNG